MMREPAGRPPSGSTKGNRLLEAISASEREWLESRWSRVSLEFKQVLYRLGDPIDRLYFPDSGVVSLVSVMRDGRSAEVATVGVEGVIGVHVMYGATTMPCEVVAQSSVDARVIDVDDLWADSRMGGALPPMLCRYSHALLIQTMQTAGCNKLHSIRQRAARWILTMHDRVGTNSFPLTQELLGVMLGARRQSVNAVARSLQRARAIDYRHGAMVVRNRAKLEHVACECYRIVSDQFARILTRSGEREPGRATPPLCPCCGAHSDRAFRPGSVRQRTDRQLARVGK